MRVAIAFYQTCAFGDFQCQLGGMFRRLADQPEPVVDLLLFLLVAMAIGPQGAEFGEQPEAQVTADRCGIDLHPEINPAKPSFALRHLQDGPRQERRKQLAKLFDTGLEKVVNGKGFAIRAQLLARDTLHAGRRDLRLRNTDDILVGHAHGEVARDFLQ